MQRAVGLVAVVLLAGAGGLFWFQSRDHSSATVEAAEGSRSRPTVNHAGEKKPAPHISKPSDPKAAEPHAGEAVPELPKVEQADQLKAKAEAFAPSDESDDFTTSVPAGHTPKAMRKLSKKLQHFLQSPDNVDAQVQWKGIDCRKPPCVMSLAFNPDQDSLLIDKTTRFLNENSEAGEVMVFPHVIDVDKQRLWMFFSPHKRGTAAHHQFVQPAVERVRAKIAKLPSYNPSRDL